MTGEPTPLFEREIYDFVDSNSRSEVADTDETSNIRTHDLGSRAVANTADEIASPEEQAEDYDITQNDQNHKILQEGKKEKEIRNRNRDSLVNKAAERYKSDPKVERYLNSLMRHDQELFPEDDVGIYMKSLSQFKVLDPSEQKRLLKHMQEGLKIIDERTDLDTLSPDEEPTIISMVKARQALMCCNTGLVVSIAKRYVSKDSGTSIIDLSQDGSIGLSRAINRFELDAGYEFSTYATPLIESAIGKGKVSQDRTVRIPVWVDSEWRKLKTSEADLELKLGRKPTLDEICEASGKTLQEVETLQKVGPRRIKSLDEPMGEKEDGATFGNLLPDEGHFNINAAIREISNEEEVKKLFTLTRNAGTLSDKETVVLCLRYGIYTDVLVDDFFIVGNDRFIGYSELMAIFEAKKYERAKHTDITKSHRHTAQNDSMTLKEIGEIIGLKKDRVQKIEDTALSKLFQASQLDRQKTNTPKKLE